MTERSPAAHSPAARSGWEAAYQLARSAGFALALLVVLAFEHWRPHAFQRA